VSVADTRIDELRQRLERDPGSRLFAHLAEELRKAGEVEEAITVARTGLERHPSYPSARLTLGRALLDAGDAAAAKAELETAVRGAPENILASRMLAEAQETLGDLGGALAQYRGTLQMAPGDAHVEARIRALEARLGGGRGPAPGAAQQATKPGEAARPPKEGGAAGPDAAGGGEAELPPTVRVRMPVDPRGEPRAPLPPTAGAGGAGAREERAPTVSPPRHPALEEPLPPTLPMGVRARDVGGGEAPEEVKGGGVPEPAPPPLSSATLAELYLQQGLFERAVEVFRQVLEEEPGNERVRTRLAEIERMARESAADLPGPSPDEGDQRAVQRRALQRAIARLEALLAVVRQGR
jgi:tetratricopeptide (TPR) repeat protein